MIKANFNTYSSYVTDSLYQWDLNQVLSVTGLNLAVVPEVHFSNANMDKAIVRQATKVNNVVSVAIPNSLLQDPLTINAHIGIYEGDTFKVVERVDIPVIPKKRPSDYRIEDADEEVYSFHALENKIANMVKVSDFNANNTAIAARIDNIIAHNNDTNGNTELIDARTDHKGNVWASVGTAIRGMTERLANGNWINNEAILRKHLANNFNYNGAPSTGNLDSFTNDGCYLLNGVYTNSPFSNNTPFILINCCAVTNSPRTFQVAISYHNNSMLYWRVVSSATGGESWHTLDTDAVFMSRGALAADSGSLLNYTDEGSYMFSYGHTINDTPFGKNAFVLMNIVGTKNYVIQIISNLSAPQTVYSRIYKNGVATDWRLLTPNEVEESRVIVNFGDSIFGQYQDSKSISAKLATILNATVVNGGLGGTTLEPWSDGLSKYFSMVAVTDAIVRNDWTTLVTQAPLADVNYYSDTIDNLKNLDFSTVTHITLNHGTNDWSRGAVIENDNPEDTSTFKGALRYVINSLQTAFPNAKISVISVLNRFDTGDGRTMVNGNGDTLEDFAVAAKEVCSELYTNYINVFDTLGFNANTREYYFGESTVHPNENGNNVIADHIAKHL